MKLERGQLRTIQKHLGVQFKDPKKLCHALLHTSFTIEMQGNNPALAKDNERLEFFGDAILSFLISKKLYTLYPTIDEGLLSKYRSLVVSRRILFILAKRVKLHRFLFLGKYEKAARIDDKINIMADAFEAIIAAVYLDRGMKGADAFISKFFDPYLTLPSLRRLDSTQNYKNKLQEFVQKRWRVLPQYRTVAQGPEFTATVVINGREYGSGSGRSKRDAEKFAAKATFQLLRKEGA